ncbi:MAG: hypothetical protein E7628_04095 [Ruminococcaceae bacterium]|nr:hypothetical protein [Oscillospiraceae bacterium]
MKRLIFVLILVLCLTSLVSCRRDIGETPETDVPENNYPTCDGPETNRPADFRFIFTWNTYGISSYDSGTGELVKTTDATNPDDYVTELFFTEEQIQSVWEAVSKLDLDSYPDAPENYNPYPNVQSEPSQTIILTLIFNGSIKTIQAKNIAFAFRDNGMNDAGKAFIAVHDLIRGIIYASDEWKALPEYEFFYE